MNSTKSLPKPARGQGDHLVGTAADREVLTLIASAIDRKTDLQHDYSAAEDPNGCSFAMRCQVPHLTRTSLRMAQGSRTGTRNVGLHVGFPTSGGRGEADLAGLGCLYERIAATAN
jgi:hypothetical protein